MFNHTNPFFFWKQWQSVPTLPPHLPRLILANRYHPPYVRQCELSQHIANQLCLLDWEQLPHSLSLNRQGERSIPLAAYICSYLLKIDQQLSSFGKLRYFLRTHPALLWLFGFPLPSPSSLPDALTIEAILPSQQHFARKLTRLPNALLHSLLDSEVAWLREMCGESFGETVSFDTKHILAWVKENNPKAFIKEDRFDKTVQPTGDTDCKLGCKRQRNQVTPTKEGTPATKQVRVGEFYWGYASGVVATKVPNVGEFVLAELTQTFDKSDPSYFFPLMNQVEQRLERRPRFGTGDAAFDAFYVYDYFHAAEPSGFAAVPLRDTKAIRSFSEDGLPLCEASLPFHQKSSFVNRTSLVQHRRGRYGCPLLLPEPSAESCPVQHKKWDKGGCTLVMPIADGARIRYQLDRKSPQFERIYAQRTAVERIFSQATALGIERPKLRNRLAITNINTLTYILINLRMMNRLQQSAG